MSGRAGGRPLRGTLTRSATGWTVEVPARRGATTRVRRTFPTKARAEAWRAAAIAALITGDPLPEATPITGASASTSTGPISGSPMVATSPATSARGREATVPGGRYPHQETLFEQVARQWHHEHYILLNRAGARTADNVWRAITVRLMPRLRALGVHSGTDLTRDAYLALLADLAGSADAEILADSAVGGPGESSALPPEGRWLTTVQALEATGISLSTLKRRIRAGALPRTYLDDHDRRWICEGDLIAAGLLGDSLRRGPRRAGGYAQPVLAATRRILDEILRYGAAGGIDAWTLSFDPATIAHPKSSRPVPAPRRQVTLADTVLLAGHLHAVHALTLWLLRVMGLRISEAYGLHISDIIDDGDRGLMVVRRQGGGSHVIRDKDGRYTTVNEVDHLKNVRSRRVIVIPAPMMALIRHVVDVFHRDDHGRVDPDARLIPGLQADGTAGPPAFRSALIRAATEIDLDLGADPEAALLAPRPHDLRKGLVTDLTWTPDLDAYARRRFVGHAPGSDVHASVYVLDHPDLAPLLPIAEALEADLGAVAPAELLVPTAVPCTTGMQSALAARRHEIDQALERIGWYAPARLPEEDLLTAGEIAALLDTSVVTVRAWLRTGVIPAQVVGKGPRGKRRAARVADVLAFQAIRSARRRIARLADELGLSTDRLRDWIAKEQLAVERVGGEEFIPAATEKVLREMVALERSLRTHGVTVAQAAETLGVSVDRVNWFIESGRLTVLPDLGPDRLRYITRTSLTDLQALLATGMPARRAVAS